LFCAIFAIIPFIFGVIVFKRTENKFIINI
jgi:hypothetical protein